VEQKLEQSVQFQQTKLYNCMSYSRCKMELEKKSTAVTNNCVSLCLWHKYIFI